MKERNMAENNRPQQPQHQQGGYQQGNRPDSPKPESASNPGQRAEKERERDRAGQIDHAHHDNARGDRNPGNFQNREAGRQDSDR
jgi:hypothetical protein